jgi:hypothetical protein
MVKVVIASCLVAGLLFFPSSVAAQDQFEGIRAQVHSQVQERQLQPPSPSATASTAATTTGTKSTPKPDHVFQRWLGDWIMIRRVEGQLYLSLAPRR